MQAQGITSTAHRIGGRSAVWAVLQICLMSATLRFIPATIRFIFC
jgi:hypothetical protein